jgi:hypothetical protein
MPWPPRAKNSVGAGSWLPALADLLSTRQQLVIWLPRRGDAGQIALDVGGEDRHARSRDLLSHQLQGLGLAGTGGPCYESMPVQHAQRDADHSAANSRVILHQDAELDGLPVERVALDDPLHLLGELLGSGLSHVPNRNDAHRGVALRNLIRVSQ